MKLPDIDIDTQSDFEGSEFSTAVRASRVMNKQLLPHPSGYYFENIPVDEITKLSAIPFKEANSLGYFKVDLLHNSVYDNFSSRDEIKELMKKDPDWSLLESVENIEKLPQIYNHARIVLTIKPRSINDLADILAIIRPAKRHLLTPYVMGRVDRSELYTMVKGSGYQFKKSHAVAYAHVVALEMHRLSNAPESFSDA